MTDFILHQQIIDNQIKEKFKNLLKDLMKKGFVKKHDKQYLWLDSYKFFARFCVFVKDNMFNYPTHTIYPYFTPMFKKRDGSDFNYKQLSKYLIDYDCSSNTYRGDLFEEILAKFGRKN